MVLHTLWRFFPTAIQAALDPQKNRASAWPVPEAFTDDRSWLLSKFGTELQPFRGSPVNAC